MSVLQPFALRAATQAETRALARNDVAVTPFDLAGRGCFNAKLTASQTGVASATFTKVQFTNEIVDVGAYYDAVNALWRPPAGPVSMIAAVDLFGTSGLLVGSVAYCAIYKNGLFFQSNVQVVSANQINPFTTATDLPNGSDYYEVYCWAQCAAGTITVNAASGGAYFKGEQM